MKILVSALEESANLHLKEIIRYGDFELSGIFNENLDKNFIPIYSSKLFSVMGFVDVFSKIFFAKKVINEIVFLAKDVDKVLLIDAPSFNIRVAKKIKEKYPHIEIIYYILPKVWIWKKNRVKELEKYCDKLLSIFPFENRYFQNSIYVGNPILDEIKNQKLKYIRDNIVFMAGSRKSEIKALMPIFRKLAQTFFSQEKKILVIPKSFTNIDIQNIYGDIQDFRISNNSHKSLLQAKFAYICSGTATLEASLLETPFVLTYIAKPFDYFIAKTFIKPKYLGLANIILDYFDEDKAHNELIQKDVTIENLIFEYKNYDIQKFKTLSQKLYSILQFGSASKVRGLLNK